MNHTINFTHNWNNKLLCIALTTIRLRNDAKYTPGQAYDITYNKETIGTGTVVSIKHFKLADLSEFMAQIDTGYNVAAAKKIITTMYKAKNLNWDTQELSFILIRMADTKTRYIIPTELKRTGNKSELLPENQMFHHLPQSDVAALV